jgi:hypothetical protein
MFPQSTFLFIHKAEMMPDRSNSSVNPWCRLNKKSFCKTLKINELMPEGKLIHWKSALATLPRVNGNCSIGLTSVPLLSVLLYKRTQMQCD